MAEQFVFDAPPEAVDFLERLGMGTDIEGTDQQYFQASDTQRNTHQLNARYLLETRALYNTTSAGLEGRVAVPMGDVFALAFASTHATQGLPSPEDMRALQDAFVQSDDGVKTDVISQIMMQPQYTGFSAAAVQQLSVIADMSQADMQIHYAGGTIAASVAGMEVLGAIAEKWHAGEPLTEDELIVRDAILSMGAAAKLNGGAIMFSRLARLPAFQRVVASNSPASLCFVAGTPVLTTDGYKNIEDIRVGDMVVSRDEGRQMTVVKPVVALFQNPNKEIYSVTLTSEEGQTETLGATAEHPFYVEGKGWVVAAALQPGDQVVSHTSGEGRGGFLLVKSVTLEEARQDTYNFEIADTHTYFVGHLNALVHNQCNPGDLIANGGRQLDNDTIIGAYGNRFTRNADGTYTNAGPATQTQITQAGVTVRPNPATNRTFDFATSGAGNDLRRITQLDGQNVTFKSGHAFNRTEPRRVCRRLILVSYAATGSVSRAA